MFLGVDSFDLDILLSNLLCTIQYNFTNKLVVVKMVVIAAVQDLCK